MSSKSRGAAHFVVDQTALLLQREFTWGPLEILKTETLPG